MAAKNPLDDFYEEIHDGNTNFQKFMDENEQVKLIMMHVIEEFTNFSKSGVDPHTKYSKEFLMQLAQRHSFLYENGIGETLNTLNTQKKATAYWLLELFY